MRVLVTGGDGVLAASIVPALASSFDLRLMGRAHSASPGLEGFPYTAADLCEAEQAERVAAGADAVLHLEPFTAPQGEAEALVRASRGTFVLLHAALKWGVGRVVLASRLELLTAYPESCVVDENWRPRPRADAASLAPYLAELTVREFVRAEALLGICLRLGEADSAGYRTSPEDAARAFTRALEMDLGGRKHRWWLFHVDSSGRFPRKAAEAEPLCLTGGEG
jgi:nucleoside-diphosphate-sugar epimerase